MNMREFEENLLAKKDLVTTTDRRWKNGRLMDFLKPVIDIAINTYESSTYEVLKGDSVSFYNIQFVLTTFESIDFS